jgi:Zn-dependent M28 family amino/carboxypeptidase
MTLPGDTIEGNPPFFVISLRMANKILEGTGINLEEFENKSAEAGKPASQELKNKMIRFETKVNSKIINARNVVGVLKGKDTTRMIVVGGHYDHLGKHHGFIWNGADDNASGTVGVMTIAKACLATGEKPEKTIVFAAWTGEEKGLWGSRYFADHPYDDLDIVMNLNYDMISRDNKDDENKNQCSMTYTKAFGAIEEVTRQNIGDFDIDLDISYRPSESARGGSDHAPFAQKGIPYFYFMAGFPPEYHQPDDHIELVNIPKMTNIIRIGFLNIWNFANSEDWQQ